MNNDAQNPADEDSAPDHSITPELFLEWRAPRIGVSNPERVQSLVWEWLVRSKLSAYLANKKFDGPDSMDVGPGWCFSRFGQSSTALPDDRTIMIGGEHEDHYDPDFFIYNDVTILHPDGRIEFFIYPHDVFPPTDSHSATLVGQRIILIGNIGYPADRRPGTTQVLALDLGTFAMAEIPTSGTPPGWLHGHRASLSENGTSILVQGGKLDSGEKQISLIENIDDWCLHLGDFRWERLTDRQWPRWEIVRKDRASHHLFEYQVALFDRRYDFRATLKKTLENKPEPVFLETFPTAGTLEQSLGSAPDLDLFERLYVPAQPHDTVPPIEDEHGVHRVRINGVVVRYVEDFRSIQLTIEGHLPNETALALASELREKLTALENYECEMRRLG